jgi:hypothetical protein
MPRSINMWQGHRQEARFGQVRFSGLHGNPPPGLSRERSSIDRIRCRIEGRLEPKLGREALACPDCKDKGHKVFATSSVSYAVQRGRRAERSGILVLHNHPALPRHPRTAVLAFC